MTFHNTLQTEYLFCQLGGYYSSTMIEHADVYSVAIVSSFPITLRYDLLYTSTVVTPTKKLYNNYMHKPGDYELPFILKRPQHQGHKLVRLKGFATKYLRLSLTIMLLRSQ